MRFDKPVRVQIGRVDRCRIVLDTQDAAELLLHSWPSSASSEKKRLAMKACLDVLRGKRHPGAARRAFVSAAVEARVFLDDIEA
jgi:hypothetical protein